MELALLLIKGCWLHARVSNLIFLGTYISQYITWTVKTTFEKGETAALLPKDSEENQPVPAAPAVLLHMNHGVVY